MAKIFKALSALLSYPTRSCRRRRRDARVIDEERSAAADERAPRSIRWSTRLRGGDLYDLQES